MYAEYFFQLGMQFQYRGILCCLYMHLPYSICCRFSVMNSTSLSLLQCTVSLDNMLPSFAHSDSVGSYCLLLLPSFCDVFCVSLVGFLITGILAQSCYFLGLYYQYKSLYMWCSCLVLCPLLNMALFLMFFCSLSEFCKLLEFPQPHSVQRNSLLPC